MDITRKKEIAKEVRLAVQMVGQAIMNKHGLSKSEAAEVMIKTGVLPESLIRKTSNG
jgi:hypothetical protein